MIKFLTALLLFLPTTALFESYVYVLFIPIVWMMHSQSILKFIQDFRATPFAWKYLKTVWLVLLLLITVGLNSLFGGASFSSIVLGPVFLMPIMLLAAYGVMDLKVLRYLLLFIAIEIIFGWVEYIFGVNTFIYWFPKYYKFMDYESFYHTRVFGFADNSSYLAQKVLVGLVFLLFVPLRLTTKQLISAGIVMLSGLVITFGRTVIVTSLAVMFVYLIVFAVKKIGKRADLPVNENKSLFATILGFLTFIGVTFSFWQYQFTRLAMKPRFLDASEEAAFLENLGLGNIEMAGRRELWTKALHFIQDNLLLGNHSQRFLIDGKHAHNSLLEYLATHGILITILMLSFIFLNLKRNSMPVLFAFGLYSLGQYGIFWDISFFDILFFGFLLFSHKLISKHENDPLRAN